MSYLILMRHGQSLWNKANLFTGWVDVPLSREGIFEALQAGQILSRYAIDWIYTSTLIRAQMTAMLAMAEHPSQKTPLFTTSDLADHQADWQQHYGDAQTTIPVVRAWQLNERMYGQLQGLNKAETKRKYGEEQVQLWRRSYDIAPPGGESLAMTVERAYPYFQEEIRPKLESGQTVFVSAHGNSLRGIIMRLDDLSQEQVLQLEIPTGQPIIYRFDGASYLKLMD